MKDSYFKISLALATVLFMLNLQLSAQPTSAFVYRPFLQATKTYTNQFIGCAEVYYQLRDTTTGQIHGMDDKPYFKKIPVLAVQIGHHIYLPWAITHPVAFFPDFQDEIISFPFVTEVQKMDLYNHKGEQIDQIGFTELDTVQVLNSEDHFLYRFKRNSFSEMVSFDSLNYHLKEGIMIALHYHEDFSCNNITASIDFNRKAGVSFDGYLLNVTELPDSLIGGLFLHPYPAKEGVHFAFGGMVLPFKPVAKVLIPDIDLDLSLIEPGNSSEPPQIHPDPNPEVNPETRPTARERRQARKAARRAARSGT